MDYYHGGDDVNPVSYARLLTSTSASQLSRELKVSKQYISRLEQGIYEKPNDATLKWTARILDANVNSEVNENLVERLYHKWQWEKRQSTKANRNLQPLKVTEHDRVSQAARLGGNTAVIYYYIVFAQWMDSYWDSVHGFCVDMCLHPSPVADYYEGKTYSMPEKLVEVLTELNLLGEGFKTNER